MKFKYLPRKANPYDDEGEARTQGVGKLFYTIYFMNLI
jgi:hypothetical protein